jgi:hypothetical protein
VEVGHRISVDAVDLETVADVDVAVVPKLSRALPGCVDDVTIEGETNWSEGLGDS